MRKKATSKPSQTQSAEVIKKCHADEYFDEVTRTCRKIKQWNVETLRVVLFQGPCQRRRIVTINDLPPRVIATVIKTLTPRLRVALAKTAGRKPSKG